jgi:flagellar hook-length control protein FliK
MMSMEASVSASPVKQSHGAHGSHGAGHGKKKPDEANGFASLLSGQVAQDDADSSSATSGILGSAGKGKGLGADEALADAADLAGAADAQETLAQVDQDDDLQGKGKNKGKTALLDDAADTKTATADVGQVAQGADLVTNDAAAQAAAAALAALGIDVKGLQTQGQDSADALAAAGHDAAASGRIAATRADAEATAQTAATANRQEAQQESVDHLSGTQRQAAAQRNQTLRANAEKADARAADASQAIGKQGQSQDTAERLSRSSEAGTLTGATNALGGGADAQQATLALQSFGTSEVGRLGTGERSDQGRISSPSANDLAALSATVSTSSATQGLGSNAPVLPVAPDSGLMTEMQVADQVNYWIGRGATNAEVSVEGLTENPIHISIAMQGQEASVQFRAEQEQTRQVLQDAVPHLRNLLEQQGLSLGDVSIGNSNAGAEASAQQAREQAAGRGRLGAGSGSSRGANQGELEPLVATSRASRPLPAGRTLDEFV